MRVLGRRTAEFENRRGLSAVLVALLAAACALWLSGVASEMNSAQEKSDRCGSFLSGPTLGEDWSGCSALSAD